MDVVDRVHGLGVKGDYLSQIKKNILIKHKHFINPYGEEMQKVRNRKWSSSQ
ncbi:phosphoketolase [Mucilaginibacter xinganensis]|uniref:Phosphoketolase n=1 Tax=Mucilaginibacter xinganensis TaxID=1234841 RepID=A0A223NYH6_9SPHI|nr:phosphoketolase [Mucilaginibacter xinganensis]